MIFRWLSVNLRAERIRAVLGRLMAPLFVVLAGPLPLVGIAQTTAHGDIPAFRTPKLKGMNLYPARAITRRYVDPSPPWLHFHIHCAIDNGNMYVDGNVTNNSNQAVPGVVIYVVHHGTPIMRLTSDLSGDYHGAVALTASPIAAPPGTSWTPIYCAKPDVKVGTPSHVNAN